MAALAAIDIAYVSSGSAKLFDGAWFPLMVGMIIFTLLTTWSMGAGKLMRANMAEGRIRWLFSPRARTNAERAGHGDLHMTSSQFGVPSALLHNIKHNKVLHSRVVILTVLIDDMPYVDEARRTEVKEIGQGLLAADPAFRLPRGYRRPQYWRGQRGRRRFRHDEDQLLPLSRQTLITSSRPGMPVWRKAVCLDAAKRHQRDGILQAADQPGRRAGQPGRI